MRLRNVKNAKDILAKTEVIISNPEKYRGEYQKLFKNDNPIHIEIGMGKGDFIIGMALANPNINYIGLEKYDSVLVRACQKIEQTIPNLRLIRYDATFIDQIFNREISKIYLNHSDPWPKDRHAKRRLTSPYFANLYQLISKGNVEIEFKTDNLNLFEYSLIALKESGYQLKNIDYDYDNKTGIMTEYEQKFRNKGLPIYFLNAIYNINDN